MLTRRLPVLLSRHPLLLEPLLAQPACLLPLLVPPKQSLTARLLQVHMLDVAYIGQACQHELHVA